MNESAPAAAEAVAPVPPAAPTPAPAAAAVVAAPRTSNGAFFAMLLAVVALGVACYSLYLQLLGHRDGTVAGYYVLDLQKLLSAKMAMAMEAPAGNQLEAQAEVQRVLAAINAQLLEYGRAGYVVLKRESVVSMTPEQDITPEVAAKLGIDLNKKPEEVAKRLFEERTNALAAQIPGAPGATPAPPGGAPVATPRNPPLVGVPPAAPTPMTPEMREMFQPPPPLPGEAK